LLGIHAYMRYKNVIILNDYGYVNGGSSQVALNTALGLAPYNLNIYYFCAAPPIDQRLLQPPNIHVICTGQADILSNPNRLAAAQQGLWNPKSRKQLAALLSTCSPADTVIHVHGWTKALSHSVLQIAIARGFPMVLTMHDYFMACPNGGFYNYQRNTICQLQPLSLACVCAHCDARHYIHKLWRVLRAYIRRDLLKIPARLKAFIAVSQLSHDILAPHLPANSSIYLLPNPVDTQRTARVEVSRNSKIFAVGRLAPEKGFDLVAQAARELGLELVFIGDGEHRETLSCLNPEAHFTGWLSPHLVQEKLREARCLVFSSNLYETQGLVVSEAASLGIPAIVSDVTAARELIIHKTDGLLFQNNSIEDLKQKLLWMQADAFVENLGSNAYEKFWQSSQLIEHYIASLLPIYDRVMVDYQKTV